MTTVVASRAYAQSKLAQIMFTFDLARELDPETVTGNFPMGATELDAPGVSPMISGTSPMTPATSSVTTRCR